MLDERQLQRVLEATDDLPPAEQAEILAQLARQQDTTAQRRELLLRNALAAVLRATPEDATEALGALLPQVTGGGFEQCLEHARRIRYEGTRAEVLTRAAGQLTGDRRAVVVSSALGAVQAITYSRDRLEMFSALAGYLDEQQMADALAWARSLPEADYPHRPRAEALTVLAEQVVTSGLVQATLSVALQMRSEPDRAGILAVLAPRLAGKELEDAISASARTPDAWAAVSAVARLAPDLPQEARCRVAARAFSMVTLAQDDRERGLALADIAPHLGPEVRLDAVAEARAIADPRWRAEALVALAAGAGPDERAALMREVLTATRDLDLWEDDNRLYVLTQAAALMNGSCLEEASTLVLEILNRSKASLFLTDTRDTVRRVHAAVAFLPQVPDETRNLLATAAIDSAMSAPRDWDSALALAMLAPVLPKRHLSGLLKKIEKFSFVEARALAYSVLAPRLAGRERHLRDLALRDLRAEPNLRAEPTVRAIAALLPTATNDERAELLRLGRAAIDSDDELDTDHLEILLPALEGSERTDLVHRWLASVARIEDEDERFGEFERVIPFVSASTYAETATIAEQLTDPCYRVSALTGLSHALPDQAVLDQAVLDQAVLDLRSRLVTIFASASSAERHQILELLADYRGIQPALVGTETLETIASGIVDVCAWDWS